MFQPPLTQYNDDSRHQRALIPCPVYGGILDSPLVLPKFAPPPISPPKSPANSPLLLPLDTSTPSIVKAPSARSQTGLYSPVSPPWPATPPNSADSSMCISDSDSPMFTLSLSQDVYDAFAPLSTPYEPKSPSYDPPYPFMDIDSESEESTPEDVEILVDEDEPYDFLSSPFYPPPPELDEDDGFSPTSPLSPSLDIDDILDMPPCSPTLRLNTSLPNFQDIWNSFSSNLFSLPGAEVDDDLIPSELSLPKINKEALCEPPSNLSSPSPFSSLPSLLMVNSTANLPIPTTPPPDQLDIQISRLDEYPDLRRLAILRKKSQEMEKGLKVVEEQLLQQGEVQARADVRRERKWHKERSREITAMLKLVVGEDIFSRPAGSSLPAVSMGKKTIATMDHLVARMVFKRRERNDLPRPIAGAIRGPLEKLRDASRLCHSVTADEL